MKQSEIIQQGQGDAWWQRNKSKPRTNDRVLAAIERCGLKPQSILEIGCGNGWRLNLLRQKYGAVCSGIDLSWEAIKDGKNRFSSLNLRVAAAADLGYVTGIFDCVILGFVMYLVDREDLFKVMYETDRVLFDGGAMVVNDFHSDQPHSRLYAHDRRLRSYKHNVGSMFSVCPNYRVVEHTVTGAETDQPTSRDDQVAVTILKKDIGSAWPLREP